MRRAVLLAGLLASVAGALESQQMVTGFVYDSLLHAPLASADLWLRGTNWRARSDTAGRFAFDSVLPGRYTLLVSHPGLDSAGLYTLALPFAVTAGDTAPAHVATPSLATLWQRRCGEELTTRVDSGIVFGVIQDAASGAHLEGAGVLLHWLRITQTDPVTVSTQPRSVTARTDPTGTYAACGVSHDTKLSLRGYASTDSTGLIDLQLGRRAVGRQDLLIALAPARTPAVLRGNAQTDEHSPLFGGRVSVREGPSTMVDADGGYILRGVAPGTQWVTVQAIGRTPVGQAVDFHQGDTTSLDVALPPLAVTLSPVRVTGQAAPTRQLQGFEERQRLGLGYFRSEQELQAAGSLRGALGTLPTVRFARGAGHSDFIVMLPNPGVNGRGYCTAALYIDGFVSDYSQLQVYHPDDLVGVELYPRASSAPVQYQSVSSGCGVLLIWTKYLK
ncbi:MAG TPA: carboxypeptidase-like regulatory domain-containing protein [Gemmatimonadales bacterium]|nr:carboxypeptidase-like regulatory domain-containing protein [Gemmatimonadales bacterium]